MSTNNWNKIASVARVLCTDNHGKVNMPCIYWFSWYCVQVKHCSMNRVCVCVCVKAHLLIWSIYEMLVLCLHYSITTLCDNRECVWNASNSYKTFQTKGWNKVSIFSLHWFYCKLFRSQLLSMNYVFTHSLSLLLKTVSLRRAQSGSTHPD